MLLRDKLEEMDSPTATATSSSLTHARWQKYGRLLKQYEGWASALRAEYGHDTITFLEESSILDEGLTDAEAVIGAARRRRPGGRAATSSLISRGRRARSWRAWWSATPARPPPTGSSGRCSTKPEYQRFVRVHTELMALAGTPPFQVELGKSERGALRSRTCAARARGLPRRHAAAALQGPRRDERRPALRHHDGPRAADPPARHGRRRQRAPTRSSRC